MGVRGAKRRRCKKAVMAHCDLWKLAFSDTDQYIDFYFRKKAPVSLVYSEYEDGKLASMAFCTPYTVSFFSKTETMHYIVGVATAPEYRRQGRMQELLLEGMMERFEDGEIMTYLSPAKEEYYRPLGFEELYRQQISVVESFGSSKLIAVNYSRLSEEKKKVLIQFVNQKLSSSRSHMYVKRNLNYYRLLRREMRALDGGVLVFCNTEGEIVGTLSYGTEGRQCEVYELICHKKYATEVINSFYTYLKEKKVVLKEKKITFFDTEFLPEESQRKKGEKPFLMGRIVHLGNFLKKVPSDIICHAFEKKEGSSFWLQVTDTMLPVNTGKYLITSGNAIKGSESIGMVSVTIEELEKRIFPYLNPYINDIT